MEAEPEPADEEPQSEPAPTRVRLAIRRWRLWWRFQLRALRWRGPLRRLRLLRQPGEDVALAGAQLAIGRLLGAIYLQALMLVERTRIARARIPDRTEPARTTVALLRFQRTLVGALTALILMGLGLDAVVREYGADVARAFGIEDWLRETFDRPGEDTLRNLLAAAAGGTATILGLVLSISLIVWQTTADRYRSTTIVGFLLRERIGAAVVRLLALGFAYSLWVLALLEVTGRPPFVSAALALMLSTAAVLSLISYRETGLLGYIPANISSGLRREIAREQHRAARPGAGPSVSDYSRRVVAGNLQIFDDLVTRLLREGDSGDVSACIEHLGKALSLLVRAKSTLDRGSLFFERHKERLPAGGEDIDERLVSEGLMNPTADVPDHVWVERRVLAIAARVARSELFVVPQVAESVFGLWAESLQYAWFVEEEVVVGLILDEVERVAGDPRVLDHPELAEHVTTIAWLLVEAVGNGVRTTAEDIVDATPWKSDADSRSFPWSAKEDARQLGLRIRREIAIVNDVVTPRWAMIADVEQRRAPRLREQQRALSTRATTLCGDLVRRAADEKAPAGPRAAKMTIRLLLRLLHHRLDTPPIGPIAPALAAIVGRSEGEEANELRADAGLAARMFAAREHWPAAYALLDIAARAGLLARVRETDERRGVIFLFDTLFTAAAVFGWGELHRRNDHGTVTGRYVQHPFADLDRLKNLIDEHLLHQLMLPVIVYHRWFQPLIRAVHELPDRVVPGSGLGILTEKDHPSHLIARAGHGLLFGPNECLEDLVSTTMAARATERTRLVTTLRLVHRREAGR